VYESVKFMISADFGMRVEDKQCKLYDLTGSWSSGQSEHDVMDELCDVSGKRVVGGCLWLVRE